MAGDREKTAGEAATEKVLRREGADTESGDADRPVDTETDPAEEAASGGDSTTAPTPAPAPAAPTTAGPTGAASAAPNPGAGSSSGGDPGHAGSVEPKLFAGALLVLAVAVFLWRRRS